MSSHYIREAASDKQSVYVVGLGLKTHYVFWGNTCYRGVGTWREHMVDHKWKGACL